MKLILRECIVYLLMLPYIDYRDYPIIGHVTPRLSIGGKNLVAGNQAERGHRVTYRELTRRKKRNAVFTAHNCCA